MAEVWKTEFHVFDENGEAFAWEPDFPSAASHCNPNASPKAVRIDKVTYYLNDSETVWEAGNLRYSDGDELPAGVYHPDDLPNEDKLFLDEFAERLTRDD